MPRSRCTSWTQRWPRRVIAAALLFLLILLNSAWRLSISSSPYISSSDSRPIMRPRDSSTGFSALLEGGRANSGHQISTSDEVSTLTSPSRQSLNNHLNTPATRSAPKAFHGSQPDGLQDTSKLTSSSGMQRPHVVLHWTASSDNSFSFHVDAASFSGCPASDCVATSNRSRLPEADAVLFHGRSIKLSELPQQRRPQQLFVFALRESPLASHLDLKKLDGFFNLTMTYSRHADVVYPYAETATGEQDGVLPYFHRRRRPVAWLVSHCVTHSRREQYVSQLQRHLPVDTFGGCGQRHCPGPRLDCYRRLAASHLFYLAFENSLCDDYITEKFWLALRVGLVPVVRGPGPEAYRRVAPPHSFIHVDGFTGPAALATYLLSLARNRTAYSQYHVWRRTHHVRPPRAMCDLCDWLGRTSRQYRRVRLTEVWAADKHCRGPRDLDSGGAVGSRALDSNG